MIARVRGLACHVLAVDDGSTGSLEDMPAATRAASRGLSQKQLQPNVMGASRSPSSAGIRAWGDVASRMKKAALQDRGTNAPAMAGRRTFTNRPRTKKTPPQEMARCGNGAGRLRPTASSYAARRLRLGAFILGQLGKQESTAVPPASRVSISELLGGLQRIQCSSGGVIQATA